MAQYAISMYFGGTSILIIVNVIMDMFQQIQSHMLTSQYGAMLKNNPLLTQHMK